MSIIYLLWCWCFIYFSIMGWLSIFIIRWLSISIIRWLSISIIRWYIFGLYFFKTWFSLSRRRSIFISNLLIWRFSFVITRWRSISDFLNSRIKIFFIHIYLFNWNFFSLFSFQFFFFKNFLIFLIIIILIIFISKCSNRLFFLYFIIFTIFFRNLFLSYILLLF